LSIFLDNFEHPTNIDVFKVMKYQQLMFFFPWHQSCFPRKRGILAIRSYFGVFQVHEMSKPFGWARRAKAQGAAASRRTPLHPDPGARETNPGTSLARLAAAVGLVSPPGGIVLWDEWHARLNSRGSGDNPETTGKSDTAAKTPWRRPAKEVREDRIHKWR
jgi:hypothetical protein